MDLNTDNPRTPGITRDLLTRLREQLADSTNYHRKELLKRTLRRLAIIELKLHGASRREVCTSLRVGTHTVTKWWKRFRESNNDAHIILDRLTTKKPGPRH